MANRYNQVTNTDSESHFSAAVTGELAYSRMQSTPTHLTTFNAGDIVPLYCLEVLPHDTIGIDADFVVRQTTILYPTMGSMELDLYAFFVPNRVVNRSWKTVMGENPNSSWTAASVSLAPLVGSGGASSYQVPVGSVADYYGFPTQMPIPSAVLSACHDLKFRGYIEIYNEFFRDQNYQPPIPFSKLNVFEGFFDHSSSLTYAKLDGTYIGTSVSSAGLSLPQSAPQDDSVGVGAVKQAVYGNLTPTSQNGLVQGISLTTTFNALGAPLKANKLHDYFTSGLPSPMKGPQVLLPLAGDAPVLTSSSALVIGNRDPLTFRLSTDGSSPSGGYAIGTGAVLSSGTAGAISGTVVNATTGLYPANLYVDLSQASSATLSDLRMAAVVQQVYEQMSRSGSRYREFVRAFFGLEVDNPYKDIPTYLGHIRRGLDLYQTAQTSASEVGSTAQGNLAAFGYTSSGGQLFAPVTFLEHGYIHILGVVRHRNVYTSFMARDNFRLNMLDWFLPQMANISEQPVFAREVNPFVSDPAQVFNYQEAWAEYRYDPDYVTGLLRSAPTGGFPVDVNGQSNVASLSSWTYVDDFNSSLEVMTGSWLQSNSQAVLDRTLATTSAISPQLKGQFLFKIDKERPMPTYSVPGLDIF